MSEGSNQAQPHDGADGGAVDDDMKVLLDSVLHRLLPAAIERMLPVGSAGQKPAAETCQASQSRRADRDASCLEKGSTLRHRCTMPAFTSIPCRVRKQPVAGFVTVSLALDAPSACRLPGLLRAGHRGRRGVRKHPDGRHPRTGAVPAVPALGQPRAALTRVRHLRESLRLTTSLTVYRADVQMWGLKPVVAACTACVADRQCQTLPCRPLAALTKAPLESALDHAQRSLVNGRLDPRLLSTVVDFWDSTNERATTGQAGIVGQKPVSDHA